MIFVYVSCRCVNSKKIEIGSLNFGKKKHIYLNSHPQISVVLLIQRPHTPLTAFFLSLLFYELAACFANDNQPWEFKDNLTNEKRFVINVTSGNINSSFELQNKTIFNFLSRKISCSHIIWSKFQRKLSRVFASFTHLIWRKWGFYELP